MFFAKKSKGTAPVIFPPAEVVIGLPMAAETAPVPPPVNSAAHVPAVTQPPVTQPPVTQPAMAAAVGPDRSTPSDALQRQQMSRTMSAIYGSITRVLAGSLRHQSIPLAELKWLVAPATLTGQYAIGEGALDPSRPDSPIGPVAVVMWGRLSEEVDRQLMQAPNAPLRLNPEHWQSGDIPWILDAVGSKPVVDRIISELLVTQFKGKALKIRMPADDGSMIVGQFAAAA